jgi:DNA-binding NarL/FixJ family response regulator
VSIQRTIVVIDDHTLFREGLRGLLENSLSVVGEGATSGDALRLVRDLNPDVLLLDVEIPGAPAEQTIAQIRRCHPDVAVVVLTMHSDSVLERQLLRAGAAQFVVKTVSGEALVAIVERAAPGGSELETRTTPDHSGLLTIRELEVLRMIAQAYTNRDISVQLQIAEGTVKRHTTNMYLKLGATSRIDAVRKAARLGLLPT